MNDKALFRSRLSRAPLTQAENAALRARLFALEEYQRAESIFIYVSVPPEPDTRGIILSALSEEKRVAAPRLCGPGRMRASLLNGLDGLISNRYGIPEPPPGAEELISPALCVIPCLACGRDFTRLGHGGGYYDRYLAGAGCPIVCLCPPSTLFDTVPHEAHDIQPHLILTPYETLRR